MIAATNQQEVNQQVFHEANLRQIFCNVVDSPAHCSAIMPAIIDRSPLMVAISSAGAAPVLSRQLREKLEAMLPQHLGQLAALAGKLRERVKLIPDKLARRRFWERLFSHERLACQLARGQQQAAEQSVAELLDEPLQSKGSVTLVGAGPGDAGLLTLSGLQQLQQADVVVYDRLVSQEVLALVRRDAERIFVGKEAGRHCVPQQAINQLLLEQAQLGKQVVRLKGGDPFIFGRGGEELETLAEAGIPFSVVPGITAASGCAAYSGIPLTHRDHAQRVQFITGHDKEGNITQEWSALAGPPPDPGVLHGAGPRRPHSGCAANPRHARSHPGGAGGARHPAQSAGGARRAAAVGRTGPSGEEPEPHHHRLGGHSGRQAGLVWGSQRHPRHLTPHGYHPIETTKQRAAMPLSVFCINDPAVARRVCYSSRMGPVF